MANPVPNEIGAYFHCRRCLEENRTSKIGVGWTPRGVQVWCEGHDCNIVHLDFRGQKVAYYTGSPKPEKSS